MTENATEVAAPETTAAPSVEVTPAAPETPPEVTPAVEAPAAVAAPEPGKPLSRAEVRAQGRARRAEAKAAKGETAPAAPAEEPVVTPEETGEEVTPVVDKNDRTHHPESGKYLPETGEQTTEAEPVTTQAPDQVTEPEGAAQTPEPIRIDIPDGHPVREMGPITSFTANSPDEEAALKTLVKGTYIRRGELDRLQTKYEESERGRLAAEEINMRQEAHQSADEKWMQTKEYREAREEFQSILDTNGRDPASAYWRGKQADLQTLRDAEFTERQTAAQGKRDEEAGNQWANDAWERVQRLPAPVRNLPNFGKMFTEELDTFNAKVSMGHFPEIDQLSPAERPAKYQEEFTKIFSRRIHSDPGVVDLKTRANAAREQRDADNAAKTARAKAEADATTAAVQKQAVTDFQKKAAEKRLASPPNPLASVPVAAAPAASPPAGPVGQPRSTRMPLNEVKKQAGASARARGRALTRT